MSPESENTYYELTEALGLPYGDQNVYYVYRVQLKARRHLSVESLQVLETSANSLTRLAYPEDSEDFRTQIAFLTFVNAIRDCDLQKVVRMAWHQNS